MSGLADDLAEWAATAVPTGEDLALAQRALVDTLAVAVAGRRHPFASLGDGLQDGGRWAVLAHLLDYDDLHVESTSHISAVCVPAALETGGDARAYLAGAGVMARLGQMLGWSHYQAGWHATSTAGAPAAAVTAAVAAGLDVAQIATAIALAVPAAGGVRRSFGTSAKPLQVGFAVDAGVRAAKLAAAGATADPAALDLWLTLVAGRRAPVEGGPMVPGGLAVKVYPCCYALQRPIEAVRAALGGSTHPADAVEHITVLAPDDALTPLIHSNPSTGLQAKFSLQYAVVAAALDGRPGFASFTDAAVRREDARALMERVRVRTTPGGDGLLAGRVQADLALAGGDTPSAVVEVPLGAPGRPMSHEDLQAKVEDCAGPRAGDVGAADWGSARRLAPELLGASAS